MYCDGSIQSEWYLSISILQVQVANFIFNMFWLEVQKLQCHQVKLSLIYINIFMCYFYMHFISFMAIISW